MKPPAPSLQLPLDEDPLPSLQTKWSLVWQAGHGTERSMNRALEEICRTYWMPVYSFVRRRGSGLEDAEDLTQGFFYHLLEKKWFSQVDPNRGKLRSYLFASLGNFLVSAHLRAHAGKRAGSYPHIEFGAAEMGYQKVLTDGLTPDLVFQRRWALDAVENALAATRKSYLEQRPDPLVEALFPKLRDPAAEGPSSVALAEKLGVSPENVRQTLYRMRKRFAEELFREVGQTIESRNPQEIRAELRTLLDFL